jgi:hypothetical protein
MHGGYKAGAFVGATHALPAAFLRGQFVGPGRLRFRSLRRAATVGKALVHRKSIHVAAPTIPKGTTVKVASGLRGDGVALMTVLWEERRLRFSLLN